MKIQAYTFYQSELNENFAQFDTVEVTKDVISLDPTRLITCASGWDDFPVGDILDLHVYPGPSNGGTKGSSRK